MPLFELLINVALAALLVITIAYCYVLNARIRVLQDGRGELARLLKHFDESTMRASDSIAVLQSTTKKSTDLIQAKITNANRTIDDLEYIIDRAEKVADQLEAGINIGRTARKVQHEEKVIHSPSTSSESRPPASPRPQPKEAESMVHSAVKDALSANAAREAKPDAAAQRASSLSSLQAMLEKIASRTGSEATAKPQKSARTQDSKARSRVEQELLDIIRAGKG